MAVAMKKTNLRVVETTSRGVADKIASLRQDRSRAQQQLEVLRQEMDEQLLDGGDADGLAAKVTKEERRIAAFSREIARLEGTALPRAAALEKQAARSAAMKAAKALHAERLEMAQEIQDYGEELNKLWQKLKRSEQRYTELLYEAGLEPREIHRAAFAGAAASVAPALAEEIADLSGIRLVRGPGPVAVVQGAAPDKQPMKPDWKH